MITKLQIQKSYYLLDKCHLSLGELQNKTVIERLSKKGRKPKSPLTDTRPIVKVVRRVKGTGIPASTIQKFQRREIKLGRTSARKLASMYDRLMFQRLRGAGVNQKESRRLKSSSPDEIKKITSNYLKNARKIQHNYEQTYHDSIKAYKKQERDKLKPQKPKKSTKPVKPSKFSDDSFSFDEPAPIPSDRPERPSDDEDFRKQDIRSTTPKKPKKSTKPVKPSKFSDDSFSFDEPAPIPSDRPERPSDDEDFRKQDIRSTTPIDEDSYLDEDEDTYFEYREPEPQELKEPILNDYPSLDEVIFGMGESKHLYSQWDDIADTSGLTK